MSNSRFTTHQLATAGVIAALYAVLAYFASVFGIAYGPIQCRFSEALCVLPFLFPAATPGLFVGCIIANLFSPFVLDVVFGSMATLLACLVTYRLRNIRFKGLALAASLPPVLFNAVIIGIEIAVMFPDPTSSAPIWLACITNGISVGIGELISCTVLGVVLVKLIESNAALRKVFVTE